MELRTHLWSDISLVCRSSAEHHHRSTADGQCLQTRRIHGAVMTTKGFHFISRRMWMLCSVLFFSRPRSEGWPHHGRNVSIHLCPPSFSLTLPRGVPSTSWCCPYRPCVVFLACVHLALFLALSLSPGNSLVSWWCEHSKLASLLWRCLTVDRERELAATLPSKRLPFILLTN